ncbi:phage tail tape measure protein [Streptomyces cyaneofuscatus]|uniref:phage tail tape measure protein n=1 Tax=Streptomyces cyaneofuscatus TaxID=66883 RepID=UPI00378ABDA6
MPRAASVWLDVMPSMSEFRRELRRNLEDPVAEASARAGAQGGEGLMAGMKGKVLAGAAVVGAAAGVVLMKGIEEAVAKQKATGMLKAQLDLTAAEAKKAGAAAGKLFAGTVTETIADGAAAVKAIMASGLAPEKATTKQLAAIATKAQDLTTLFEVDLAQGANAAGQMVKTGLAKNATEAFDILTRGFQTMGPRADDLADTMNEYSTIFRSLGLDARTTLGILSQGMKAGARDTDTVADALKEFQIRTTDGSKTSADGFKLLGMSAKESTAMFAAGGAGAAKGLQTVMDKLRAMKDPVDRNAAAVALFGTKAEDLAGSLFALDPSKAVADLGKVGGAAKRAGDDLRNNAGAKFEAFKRRGLMVLGDVTAKYVLPRIENFIEFIDREAVPTIRTISAGFMSGVRWVKEYGLWFAPLAIAIGGVTLAMTASAIATGITMGVIGAYSIAIRTAAAVTRAWTMVQLGFNAVMALNPVTLIVIGVLALAAAVVVAYRRVGWFRTGVQAAWTGIKAGWDLLWNQGLKPGFAAFMTGLRAVGAAGMWLWDNALKPVFSAIDTGARILATIIGVVLVMPTVLALRALAAVGTWLWTNALGPAFRAIGAAAVWLWKTAIRPQLNSFMTGLRAVGAAGKWLWTNALKPAFGWIVGGAVSLWAGVKTQAGHIMTGIRALGATGTWLWKNALKPAFEGIGTGAAWLYNNALKPHIDKAKALAKALGDAFKTGADAVGKAFNSIKEKAKTPVEFIIDTVYNKGIRGVWNEVADVFGAPTLDRFPGFARGGVLPGQSSYRQGDSHLVPMRLGEGVAVSEAMRDPYERSRLLAVNQAAMRGQSLRPFQGGGFAKGGIFDWVKGAASNGVDLAKAGVGWLKDGVKASAVAGLNSVVKPLINKISGSASLYRDMVTRIPKKMIESIIGYSGKADGKMEAAGIGGKGFKGALSWARAQAGKPYLWGGVGPAGFDCSGFLSAIENVIRGLAPNRRRWATGAFSGATAPSGWVLNARSPYTIGITNAGVGHTAGTLNGVNVESRGGDGVVVGSRARSATSAMFTHRYGLRGFASGGRPRPGELAWVGEQGPELVKFGGGDTEVYDTSTSLRMASALGKLRGFAKGTTSAAKMAAARRAAAVRAAAATRKGQVAAKAAIPADLVAFSKSLTGSAADIGKASAKLARDLAAAGGAGVRLSKVVKATTVRLQALAAKRDTVSAKIAEAKGYANDKSKVMSDFLGIAALGDVTSVGGLISGMKGKQATAKGFTASLTTLAKRGASKDLISQLEALGPDSQLAGLVSRASSGDLKQINALVKSGGALSTSYGRSMADLMYDAGKGSAKGFLTGLLAEEKAIQDAMAKLGAGAIKAIRGKKGIDARSPSRKGAAAGADVGAGVVAGMAAMGPEVASAAERLGRAAVPGGLVPVTSHRAGTDPVAALDGASIALVLDDGTRLAAHFDARVDAKLSTARRTARAGTKRR